MTPKRKTTLAKYYEEAEIKNSCTLDAFGGSSNLEGWDEHSEE